MYAYHGTVIVKRCCYLQVVELLKKEHIEWTEENRGTLLIKLDGRMNFSFVDTDDNDEDDN